MQDKMEPDTSWEDIDDESFLRIFRSDGNILKAIADGKNPDSFESNRRSLSHLADSEETGVKAADELIRNRESLMKVSKSLDGITADLKNSRRHIDSVRSVFSCLKKSLFGRKSNDKMMAIVEREEQDDGVRYRDSFVPESIRSSNDYGRLWNTSVQGRVLTGDLTSSNNPFRSEAIRENLEAVSTPVGRLKRFTASTGEEIHYQNSMLDSINDKTIHIQIDLVQQENDIKGIFK